MAATKTGNEAGILIVGNGTDHKYVDLERILDGLGYKVFRVIPPAKEAAQNDIEEKPSLILLDGGLAGKSDKTDTNEPAKQEEVINKDSGLSGRESLDVRRNEESDVSNFVSSQRELAERKRIESALRESEERYRNLFDNAPIGIYRTNTEGRILMANPAMVRMLGYSSLEEITSYYIEREDIEPTYNHEEYKKCIEETGEINGREAQWVRRDGLVIFIRENVRTVRAQDGTILYYDGAVEDITNRKWSEMALHKSEEKYRKVLEEINDGYYEVDLAGNIIFFNRSLCEILGYSEEELICLNYRDFKTAETDQEIYEEFNAVYRSGKPMQNVSYEVITKDGTKRFVETSVALIKGTDGKPLGFRGIMRDITERKCAEEALQKSERSYRLLFERNLYGVFRSTAEGKVIDCNDAFVQMHGYDSKEDLKSAGAWSLYFRPEDRMAYLDLVRMNTPILNLEVLHRRKDGSPVWALSNVTLVVGEDGESILEGVLLDISERKKVERELKASRRRLRELTRHQQMVREDERTRIAREIHDELGQAMTGMKLDLAWMRSRLPENSDVLTERMNSMVGLIDSTIHTMQRIATELRPRILDDLGLVAAIEWQAQEWQSRTGISVSFKAEPEDILISQSRSTSLFRIFQESLTNVARHANATEVRASLRRENGAVTLIVEDNGRGITDREIGHYRSLGLIGMRERALACGGTVDIARADKKGTKVIACLPLDQEGNE